MKKFFWVIFLIVSCNLFATAPFSPQEKSLLWQRILDNITSQGRVVASPSTADPDYAYHWVRDAALTMGLIESRYQLSHEGYIEDLLKRYVDVVKQHQDQQASSPEFDILGEPKFYLNGHVYDKPWGRPQNDGPALRAITLMAFANDLPASSQNSKYIEDNLYQANLEPNKMGVIKKDLEYTAHHYQDKNFDLWEEVYGDHFFTKMVQRKALFLGSQFATKQNDPDAAAFYYQQAKSIERDLLMFFDTKHQLIQSHLSGHPSPQKPLELDMAFLLGLFHGKIDNDPLLGINHPYVNNTLNALDDMFEQEYEVNKNQSVHLFGRYPGDTYDGYQTNGLGNPWFILSATAAEYYYSIGKVEKGDPILTRLKTLAPDLHLHEQLNRNTSKGQGAHDLTWSYASVISALNAREKALKES